MSNKCARGRNNKGVVLFIVILIIFIVSALAGVALNIMRSNSRRTFSSANRIKAYYSLYSAMVYTFEQLRLGLWGTGIYSFGPPSSGICPYCDPDIPYRVIINVRALGTGTAGTRWITLTTDYTYIP